MDRVVVFPYSRTYNTICMYLYITYVLKVNIIHYFMSILNKARKPKKSSEIMFFNDEVSDIDWKFTNFMIYLFDFMIY